MNLAYRRNLVVKGIPAIAAKRFYVSQATKILKKWRQFKQKNALQLKGKKSPPRSFFVKGDMWLDNIKMEWGKKDFTELVIVHDVQLRVLKEV